MMFRDVRTVLNKRKHLKMVIRSVPDLLVLFQAEPSDLASLLYTARFKST